MAYGGARSGVDVIFPYKTALRAANELARAGRVLRTNQETIDGLTRLKVDDWSGGRRDDFDSRHLSLQTSIHNVSQGLETLAHSIAVMWAECRGQQDRVNHARWVEAQKADDNVLEKAWQHIAGERDYGSAPTNPPVPCGDYQATREPIHPEYDRSHLRDC